MMKRKTGSRTYFIYRDTIMSQSEVLFVTTQPLATKGKILQSLVTVLNVENI